MFFKLLLIDLNVVIVDRIFRCIDIFIKHVLASETNAEILVLYSSFSLFLYMFYLKGKKELNYGAFQICSSLLCMYK